MGREQLNGQGPKEGESITGKKRVVAGAFVLFLFALLFMGGLSFDVSAAKPPTVYSNLQYYTEPGEIFQLNGDGFSSTTQIRLWIAQTNGREKSHPDWIGKEIPEYPSSPPSGSVILKAVSATNDVLNVRLPSVIGQGVYVVYASNDGKNWSVPYVFNKPIVYFNNYKAVQAGSNVRSIGVNLSIFGDSKVFLYNPGSTAIAPKIVSQSANDLLFTVPPEAETGTYEVWIHNGKGGRYAYDRSGTLTVRSPVEDPARVYDVTQSPYLADATGTTDATSAIQNAIQDAAANAEGGIVYFPSGTYTVSSQLQYASTSSHVVFQGEGRTKSIVKFSSSADYVNEPMLSLKTPNPNSNGNPTRIKDLGIDTNGKRQVGIELFGRNDVTIDNVMVKADNWSSNVDLYNGVTAIHFGYSRELTIVNSLIYGNNGVAGTSSIDVRIANDEIYASYPRTNREADNDSIQIYGGKRIEIVSNKIDRNSTQDRNGVVYPNGRGIHIGGNRVYTFLFGVENASSNEDIYAAYNSIANTGKTGQNNGEIIVTDASQSIGGGYTFKVASAASRTLTTSSSTGWAASDDAENDLRGNYVYIIDGKGVGQVRKIIDYASNSLTVDKEWELLPDSTSKFMVERSFTRNIFANNYAENNQKYIGFFGLGFLNTVNNNIIKSGTFDGKSGAGIGLFAFLGKKDHQKATIFYNEVRGNAVDKGHIYLENDDYLYPNAILDYPIARGNIIAENAVTNFPQSVRIGGTGRPAAIWNVNTLVMNNKKGDSKQAVVISRISDRTVVLDSTKILDGGTHTTIVK